VLKNVAKKALPVVGGALGSMVAPGIGTALGSKLGSMAGGLFEVELEAMPAEAAEFEVARRYVNLAASAARNAALASPRQGISPPTVARAAVASAARAYAPGVYRMMLRTLGGPAVARRPMGAGVRRPAMVGRYAYRGSPYRRAAGRQPYRRPYSRGATTSGYQGTPYGYGSQGTPYGYGSQGTPYGYGSQGRPGTGYSAYGRRRRYGSGYGGWYGPSAWAEPWTDGDGGVPGDGFQASGRWVRRGRQIIILGA
jgi:hypothetical protein